MDLRAKFKKISWQKLFTIWIASLSIVMGAAFLATIAFHSEYQKEEDRYNKLSTQGVAVDGVVQSQFVQHTRVWASMNMTYTYTGDDHRSFKASIDYPGYTKSFNGEHITVYYLPSHPSESIPQFMQSEFEKFNQKIAEIDALIFKSAFLLGTIIAFLLYRLTYVKKS